MSSINISGDVSGAVSIVAPSVAGSTTLTLPSVSGTVLTSASSQVTGPAFSASMSATQSISNVTATKVIFNTKVYDTNNNYDATTNYRFTPTVAGYYQFSARIATPASALGITYIYIGKNNDTSIGLNSAVGNNASGLTVSTSGLLYMNGTTDYVEAFTYQSTGGTATMGSTSSGYANFQGVLVRSA